MHVGEAPPRTPWHSRSTPLHYVAHHAAHAPAALPTQVFEQVFEQVPVEIQEAIEKKIEGNENREQKPEGETDGMGPGFVFQTTDYLHFREPYRGSGKLSNMPVPSVARCPDRRSECRSQW